MTIQLKYGTLEIAQGGYRRVDRGFVRYDRYVSHQGETCLEGCSVISLHDATARYGDAGEAYNADCACCWLHHTHSVSRHELMVKNHVEKYNAWEIRSKG